MVQVMAAIDTNMYVHKALVAGIPTSMTSGWMHGRIGLSDIPFEDAMGFQAALSINNCPPPSRIFHGRQIILEKLHKFFEQELNTQKIYLLHGLGGSGKTQIALKFIQESTSR
jgi:hypothetical protein